MGRLEEVVEATEKLEALLHEGRAMLKDMYQERKRLDKAISEARTVVVDVIDEEIEALIEERVRHHLGELADEVQSTKTKLHDDMIAGFEELTNTLLYGKRHPKKGQKSVVAELMERQGLVRFGE